MTFTIEGVQDAEPPKKGFRVEGVQDASPEEQTSFGEDMLSNFKGGVGAAGDVIKNVAKGDMIGGNEPSPKTEALADKLFPPGYEGGMPAMKDIGAALKGGDIASAIMEKGAQTTPGKFGQAVFGINPLYNAIGTAVNKYVVPGVSQATGIKEPNLQLGTMLAGSRLGKKAGEIDRTPSAENIIQPIVRGTKKATDIVSHPLDSATSAVESAARFIKPAVQKVEMSRLESSNPLYGGGLKESMQTEAAKEGERLNKKFGIKLSAGELTGNASAMAHEDALANTAKYAQRFADANEKKTNAILGKYNQTLNEIYPKSVGRVDIGDKISSAYKSTIDNLVKSRQAQAKVDFGLADKIEKGKPVIAPTNFINVLKNFIKEGDSPLATPAQQAASKQAKVVLERLKTPAPKISGILDEHGHPVKYPEPKEAYKPITINDLQNGLALYGDGAYAGGGIWKGLATASDRRFSKAAKAALEADMDAAANNQAIAGSKALKVARDNYRANSNKISDIQKTTIGKIVGGADYDSKGNLVISPEKMADKFLTMQPTEIKGTLQFLDKNHPDVAKMARRYALETVLHKAFEGTGQRGEGSSKPFPKAEFIRGLPGDDKLDAILGKSTAAKDVHDVAAALNRMVDWGASRKGSQTAQRTNILQEMAHWGKGAIYRSLASDSLVDDLLDPTRRKELAEDAKKVKAP